MLRPNSSRTDLFCSSSALSSNVPRSGGRLLRALKRASACYLFFGTVPRAQTVNVRSTRSVGRVES